jgi:hypothetical protein
MEFRDHTNWISNWNVALIGIYSEKSSTKADFTMDLYVVEHIVYFLEFLSLCQTFQQRPIDIRKSH